MQIATCRRCTYYWDSWDTCASNPRFCPHWARLTGPARDLQASGVPDPLVPLVTGPSIRADLAAAYRWQRRARLLAWLTTAGDGQTWLLAALAVAVAVAVVAWGTR
jgi:hypothetical protein